MTVVCRTQTGISSDTRLSRSGRRRRRRRPRPGRRGRRVPSAAFAFAVRVHGPNDDGVQQRRPPPPLPSLLLLLLVLLDGTERPTLARTTRTAHARWPGRCYGENVVVVVVG